MLSSPAEVEPEDQVKSALFSLTLSFFPGQVCMHVLVWVCVYVCVCVCLLLVFLITAILTSVWWWYLIMILTCISLMISHVEHLFLYLLAICISSMENVYSVPLAVLKISLFCCWFWVTFVLFNLDINPFTIHIICKCFLLLYMLPFHSVDGFLCTANF